MFPLTAFQNTGTNVVPGLQQEVPTVLSLIRWIQTRHSRSQAHKTFQSQLERFFFPGSWLKTPPALQTGTSPNRKHSDIGVRQLEQLSHKASKSSLKKTSFSPAAFILTKIPTSPEALVPGEGPSLLGTCRGDHLPPQPTP